MPHAEPCEASEVAGMRLVTPTSTLSVRLDFVPSAQLPPREARIEPRPKAGALFLAHRGSARAYGGKGRVAVEADRANLETLGYSEAHRNNEAFAATLIVYGASIILVLSLGRAGGVPIPRHPAARPRSLTFEATNFVRTPRAYSARGSFLWQISCISMRRCCAA
jgi:hypothetical protein